MSFAKLYETDVGQILVKLDANDDAKPAVQFYFKPEGLGVCATALVFKDDDNGWDKAEAAFADINESKAYIIVTDTLKQLDIMVDDDNETI